MFLTLQAAREELFSGEWDALIVASQYEPFSVVEKLVPYLGGSAHIVVQSPYLQVLTEAQSKMRSRPQYLAPNITECWLRKYQVLPGRTHPIMSASGSGGYILHTIKIYDNSIAKSTLVSERRIQRQKAAEAKRRKKAAAEMAKSPHRAQKGVGDVQDDAGRGTASEDFGLVGDDGDVEMAIATAL